MIPPSKNQLKTNDYIDYLDLSNAKNISHSNAPALAKELGSHVKGNSVRFLLWNPELRKCTSAHIKIYIPDSHLFYDKPDQHCNITYYQFEMEMIGEFAAVVVDHLQAGNKEQFGAFYEFEIWPENEEKPVTVRDPMAWSVPYGVHAPAEVYDIQSVLSRREDIGYFKKVVQSSLDEYGRVKASANILEIHTATATLEGTLASLSQRYKQIAAALEENRPLSPDDKNFIGFDGIELMPIDPPKEHPNQHNFWKPIQKPKENGSEITVHLRKPSVTNWGYDTVIFGAGAVNPSMLSTGRPHELLDLIETLHNFPGGSIKIILDVVYGHADNQADKLLPEEFFAGQNRYGKNINFKHPLVRAMMLELQRRKMNWGFDGIRVDGAQDFKYYDEEQDVLLHDDEYLKQMSTVEQHAGGISYKPWMIFEDGRPWPRDDWELASTCREIINQQKHPYQWGPLIFAYNKPYSYTYWVSKWWRLKEQFHFGEKWISGYANHDTMRRGTQTDPKTVNINFLLGNSLKMVMDNSYNNPSTTLLMNAFLPGVPMDFLQALGNAPWTFFRNTDTIHAIKIAAEEAYFTEWQVTDIEYRNSRFFKRLKGMGFSTLHDLRRFAKMLLHFVEVTNYKPETIALLLNSMSPEPASANWTVDKLNEYAFAWMEDIHEYCNVDLHTDYIDSKKSEYNLKVRKYRLENPWLNESFSEHDMLAYREPVNGSVIYYGYRKNKPAKKEIIFMANMEGQPRQVLAMDFKLPVGDPSEWNAVLTTPSVRAKKIDQPIRLSISQGILFEKKSKVI